MLPELEQWKNDGDWINVGTHRIFVRQAGAGDDLLLVHGYPTSSFDFAALWSDLTARYRVTTLDMLGMGFSDKPWQTYSVAEHADVFEAALSHFSVSDTFVLAHDLGDTVVQELLARRLDTPDAGLSQLRAVALLNGGLFAGVYRPRPIQHILSSPLGHVIGPLLPKFAVLGALKSVFSAKHPPSDRTLEQCWQLITYGGGKRVAHLVGRFNSEREKFADRFAQALVRSPAPLRFINGSDDPNSGAHMADHYQQVIPNADVVRLPGIGHWPQIEAPDAVLAATVEFFDRFGRSK
ncbi:MAG: hydrolase [Lysobacteraceae bacterium]|nr:MAG: hydrolase [Xanthomonadaceae bacterium]